MEVDATVDPRDGSFVVRTGVRFVEDGETSARFRKMVDRLIRERLALYERLADGAYDGETAGGRRDTHLV